MKTEEEINKELKDLKDDLKVMENLPLSGNAVFCQQQIISMLEWVLEKVTR